jgi:hypothetical protein
LSTVNKRSISKYLFAADYFGAVAVFLAGLIFSGTSLAVEYEGITVTAAPVEQFDDSRHGYVEYRVTVENHSAEAREIRLRLRPSKVAGQGRYISEIRRSTTVGAHSVAKVSLFQLPLPLARGSELMVDIDGEKQQETVRIDDPKHGYDGYGSQIAASCILISNGVSGDVQKAANRFISSPAETSNSYMLITDPNFSYMPGRREGNQFRRSILPAVGWSQNWLGYTRYDAVFVTAGEMEAMPPGVREALERYVECGGLLVILGSYSGVARWERFTVPGGIGQTFYPGFGECIIMAEDDIQQWRQTQWYTLQRAWQRTGKAWDFTKSAELANRAFPVVEELGIPARGLFVIVLFFAIMIGPLNLLFVSRKGKRIRLLWTVPLLSVFTCLGILCYSLLAEGIGGHQRTQTLTFLDEQSHRASTIGWTGFYCPLTPSGGLVYSVETEVTPQYSPAYVDQRDERSMSLDWTGAQHLQSGWVTARLPAHFMIRKSQRRQERLICRRTGADQITVVNGLGVGIKRLHVADEAGRVFTGGEIAAGASVELSVGTLHLHAVGLKKGLRDVYDADWIMTMKEVLKRPETYLVPLSYIAELEGAPFLEPGLEKAAETQLESAVYGILKGIDDAG